MTAGERPVFLFDLGSPYAWLSAERIAPLGDAIEWRPILLGGVFQRVGRSSWAETPDRERGMAEVERRAAAYGLDPVRWPARWPNNGLAAMRAAGWRSATATSASSRLPASGWRSTRGST